MTMNGNDGWNRAIAKVQSEFGLPTEDNMNAPAVPAIVAQYVTAGSPAKSADCKTPEDARTYAVALLNLGMAWGITDKEACEVCIANLSAGGSLAGASQMIAKLLAQAGRVH